MMKDMLDPPPSVPRPAPAPVGAASPAADPPRIDFMRYLRLVAKRMWLLVLCFLVAVVAMLVSMLRQEPVYSSTAKIQLLRNIGSLPANLRPGDMDTILGDYAQTQRAVILSSNVIQRAKAQLGLSPAEFAAKGASVSVNPGWQTAIIDISVTSLDPNFCADYANAIAASFIEYKREVHSDSSQDTAQNLSNQAKELANQIDDQENELLAFVRENSVLGIKERGNQAASLFAQLAAQSADYHTQRRLLETQQPLLAKASDEVVLATLDFNPALSSLPVSQDAPTADGSAPTPPISDDNAEALIEHGIVSPPRWDTLKRDHALLEAQLASYRRKWLDEHPYIQRTLEKIKENEEALEVEKQFALNQYYAQLEALNIKEKAARLVESEWEEEALEIERKKTEYEGLQRKIERSRRLYDLILNRLQEVDISAGIQLESVRILERALVPGASNNPLDMQRLFLAALIGLAIGLGIIVGLDFLDDSVRSPEDAARAAAPIPFLGLIPTAHWKRESDKSFWIGQVDNSSGFSEAYRNLRSSLLLSEKIAAHKVVAVVSSLPREGKTTTCANLATSFAASGYRVLLVDIDLHRGNLHRMFDLESNPGVSELLEGRLSLEQVIQKSPVEGLDFVATGAFPEAPAELVLRPSMREFLEKASQTYDMVFLDAPPVMAVSEASVIAALADTAILVIHSENTSRKILRMTVRQLLVRGVHVAGSILNMVERSGSSSYYYYPYYSYDYRYEEEPDDSPSGDRNVRKTPPPSPSSSPEA